MTRALSIVEKLFLIILSGAIVWRIAPEVPAAPFLAVFLISELLGVGLILFQRKGEWKQSAFAVTVAFLGTALPLLVLPVHDRAVGPFLPTFLIMLGGSFNLIAKLSLGRSFGLVAANRGVKARGAYRYVRHPMYAAYIINETGFLLYNPSIWNGVVLALAWTAQWLRIREEESLLFKDDSYRTYAQQVRYRLFPGLL